MKTIPTEGLGQPVSVGTIDGELKKLWEADEASTNASLMNFLIYTETPENLVPNSETARALTEEHACRAVLIGMDRAAPEPSVEAWITAHCHLAHGKKSICSEQISFLLRGKAVGRLRNTVFAHLNSDLPLVFWWQGELSDLFEDKLYRPLDRLIFDSAAWTDPKASFAKIQQAREDAGCHMVTQDLSWTRSFHFRMALAGLFDDPIAQNKFSTISKVQLTAEKDQRMTALQVIAWLAEMAKWQHQGDLKFTTPEGQTIEIDIDWTTGKSALSKLTLLGQDFEATVSSDCQPKHLCQSITSGDYHVEAIAPADPQECSHLIAEQLSRGGKNSLFMRILPGFLELL